MKQQLIDQMKFYDYEMEMIEKLSNDENVLKWVEYLLNNEYETIEEIFENAGFHEFLQMQFENPITFDEMV